MRRRANLFLTTGFTPLESPGIYTGDAINIKPQFLIEGGPTPDEGLWPAGGVKAPRFRVSTTSFLTGFTLIEVMVTLTVLGFILLMIFGAFRLGLSAWEKGEFIKEEYQKVRIVSQLIPQQIKSAFPYKIKTKKAEGDYLAFEGKTHSLKFVSTLPIKARQPEGFVYVIYEFKEEGQEGGRLLLYEQKALNRDFFEEEPKEELAVYLLEGISGIRLEYYREEDPAKNQAEEWVGEWNAKEEKRLPKALKMIITHKNGKGKENEFLTTLLISLPAYRFEDVRIGPIRRTTTQTPPGARP